MIKIMFTTISTRMTKQELGQSLKSLCCEFPDHIDQMCPTILHFWIKSPLNIIFHVSSRVSASLWLPRCSEHVSVLFYHPTITFDPNGHGPYSTVNLIGPEWQPLSSLANRCNCYKRISDIGTKKKTCMMKVKIALLNCL